MFKKNKTAKWRDGLGDEGRKRFMSLAKGSKAKQQENYFKRKQIIRKQKQQGKEHFLQAKLDREQKEREEKEILHCEIEKVCALWKDQKAIHSALSKDSSVKEKLKCLKDKLLFTKKVLNQLPYDPNCFYMSCKGKPLDEEVVSKNILNIITFNKGELSTSTDPMIGKNVILIDKDDFLAKKIEYQKKAEIQLSKQGDKSSGKRKKQYSNDMRKKVRNLKSNNLMKAKKLDECLPQISEPSDFVGEKNWHKFLSGDEITWYEGVVLMKSGDDFEVRYDDDDDDDTYS